MPLARISVLLDESIGFIRPELHGQFAEHLGGCIDGGIWVGESSAIPNQGGLRTDVVEALRRLRVPVLRWPGGCFADDYHWADGVGPRGDRARTVNSWWGNGVETNAFGTHEFVGLCRYLGCQPFLAGNVGSGSPRELRDWVEYCNFAGDSALARQRGRHGSPQPLGIQYWGVGNEAWGCGGNFTPEDYATEYRRFATYLRDLSGTRLFLIACGPDGDKPDWTRRFLGGLAGTDPRFNFRVHGLGAHYYCGTAGASATDFNVDQWYELLEKAARIEGLIARQRAVMDEFDPDRRIGLVIDEWGAWHLPAVGRNPDHLWQQSSLRDALVAAITLDTFHRHASTLVMANIAQIVNVLQSMVLTEGDRMLLTPTYHVFEMYQAHQGGQAIRTIFEADPVRFVVGNERREISGLSGSASTKVHELSLTVVNPSAALPMEAEIVLSDGSAVMASALVLTDDELTAHNTFEEPDRLRPRDAPLNASEDGWRCFFPPASVTRIKMRLR